MGGGILLVQYHSLFQLLSNIYSDFKWDKQLFQNESDIWNNDHLANYFVQWLTKQPENEIASAHIIIKSSSHNGSSPLVVLLTRMFSQYKWHYTVSKSGKKSQFLLKECIERLFISDNIVLLEEYRHPDISNLELDYFLPQYNIAFEYQVNKILFNSLIN